ncbi:MAG: alpha/beta hydrolase [Chloroflexota bacterium]
MSETRITVPCGPLALEGVFHTPAGGGPFPTVVVCHPHPQYGGDMDNNVVRAAVRGVTARGMAALRFNFRGVGRSQGVYDGGHGEQEDVRAALTYAAACPEVDATRLGLAGYSFGAVMAALAADHRVAALALIAPPLAAAELGGRLTAVQTPLLLLAGEQDPFCPADALRRLAVGHRVELVLIPGVDHFWFGRERHIEETVGDFFARHLQARQ